MGNNVTLIPKKPERHSLLTSTEDVVYMPLGSKDSHGILQVGDNLVVDKGIVSLDLNGDWYQKVLEALELSKSEILILDADGVQTSSGVEFTIKNYEDFEKYKTDKRRFLIKMKLPVVNNIDKDNRVYIHFGSKRYLVFSFVKGMNSQLTLKDLQAVVRKDTDGYSYFANFIYLDSPEFNGFVLDPAASAGTVTGLKPDGVTIGINKDGELNAIALNDGFINVVDELNFDDFKGFVHLTHAQFEFLKTYGEIKIDGKVLKYDDSLVYITPDVTVPSNPNLLVNGNFELNQRGREVYNEPDYSVDGWYFNGKTSEHQIMEFNSKTKILRFYNKSGAGIQVTRVGLYQYIENSDELLGKIVTISAKINGVLYSTSGKMADSYSEKTNILFARTVYIDDGHNGHLTLDWDNDKKCLVFKITISSLGEDVSFKVEEAKLEIGNIATPYLPRPLSAEIAMSQYADGGVKNLSNPNLLINGDFRVNQRGQTLYERTSGRVYTADRWGIWSNNCTFNVETKTLTNLVASGNAIMSQFIEDSEALFGKTLTLSVNINGTIHTTTGVVANSYDSATSDIIIFAKEIKDMGVLMSYIRVAWDNSRQQIRIDIGCTPTGNNVTIKYVKLEIGSVATEFSPRPYADELAMCQRYYQKLRIHDTQYCANVSAMYPNINLIQTLRKVPTINVVTYPSVRGNGANLGLIDNLTADLVRDNILMCTTNASSLGVVVGQLYAITNGEITADAEF